MDVFLSTNRSSQAYQSFKGARDGIDLFLEQLKIEIPHLNFLQGTVDIRSPDFVMNLAAYYKELVGFFLDCIEFLEHSRLSEWSIRALLTLANHILYRASV